MNRYIGFKPEKTPGYKIEGYTWGLNMTTYPPPAKNKEEVDKKVKSFIASFRALCVRHNITIHVDAYEEGEPGLSLGKFDEYFHGKTAELLENAQVFYREWDKE